MLMKANRLNVTIALILLANFSSFAQAKLDSVRFKLVRQYIQVFKYNTHSNEEFMRAYTVDGNYFKLDSIKKIADFCMDDVRRCLTETDEQDIVILKYTDNLTKFSVSDHPIGEVEAKMRTLEFNLYRFDSESKEIIEEKIDINDLYVIETTSRIGSATQVGKLFILFTEKDKILSFVDFRMNHYVSFMQF